MTSIEHSCPYLDGLGICLKDKSVCAVVDPTCCATRLEYKPCEFRYRDGKCLLKSTEPVNLQNCACADYNSCVTYLKHLYKK